MPLDLRGLAPLLYVFDLQISVRFYRDLLGFSVAMTSDPGEGEAYYWVMLRHDAAGGIELMLNLAYPLGKRPAEPAAARVEAHGDTQLFFGCPDLDGACAQLRAAGLAVPDPVLRHFGMRQLHFKDPDGYKLCLQWPVSPAADAAPQADAAQEAARTSGPPPAS